MSSVWTYWISWIIFIVVIMWVLYAISCIKHDLNVLKSTMGDWVTHEHLDTVLRQSFEPRIKH